MFIRLCYAWRASVVLLVSASVAGPVGGPRSLRPTIICTGYAPGASRYSLETKPAEESIDASSPTVYALPPGVVVSSDRLLETAQVGAVCSADK